MILKIIPSCLFSQNPHFLPCLPFLQLIQTFNFIFCCRCILGRAIDIIFYKKNTFSFDIVYFFSKQKPSHPHIFFLAMAVLQFCLKSSFCSKYSSMHWGFIINFLKSHESSTPYDCLYWPHAWSQSRYRVSFGDKFWFSAVPVGSSCGEFPKKIPNFRCILVFSYAGDFYRPLGAGDLIS